MEIWRWKRRSSDKTVMWDKGRIFAGARVKHAQRIAGERPRATAGAWYRFHLLPDEIRCHFPTTWHLQKRRKATTRQRGIKVVRVVRPTFYDMDLPF